MPRIGLKKLRHESCGMVDGRWVPIPIMLGFGPGRDAQSRCIKRAAARGNALLAVRGAAKPVRPIPATNFPNNLGNYKGKRSMATRVRRFAADAAMMPFAMLAAMATGRLRQKLQAKQANESVSTFLSSAIQ